jgi:hypothetical protein
MLAMGILSGVLIALGGMMFQVARHTRQSAAAGYRSAAVMTAASWASGIPWDSIDGAVGCQSDSVGPMIYARCTSVQTPTPRSKQITVVISPTGALVAQPDTVVVQRAKPRSPSPFNEN